MAALLVFVSSAASAQEIVCGTFPANTTYASAPATAVFSSNLDHPTTYDLTINGQTAFTFYGGYAFDIIPATGNAVQGAVLDSFGSVFAVPLTYGQTIGPDAQGNQWLANPPYGPSAIGGGLLGGGLLLTAGRSSDTVGEPPLTIGYFTGLESAYLGLKFQQDGKTYYGWARAGAPIVGANGGFIYDYAYETLPDTAIFAGAVPEPSTYALLGTGLAGCVLYQLTRRSCRHVC